MKRKEKIIVNNIEKIIEIYKTYGFIKIKEWLYNNYKVKLTLKEEEKLYMLIKDYFKLKKILKKLLTK